MEKLLVLLVLFLGSCVNTSNNLIDNQSTPSSPPEPISKPRIELKSVKGMPHEISMANKAILLDNMVLASDCFYSSVINGSFTETNGLSNNQIYERFRKEPIQIDVVFFTGTNWQNYVTRTIGFWYPLTPSVVYHNRHYVFDEISEASNTLHEVAHMIGFMHDKVFETSVPYQMNDIFYKCASKLLVNK